MTSVHTTVLLHETIDSLNLHDDSIVVDGTFGGGGHTREICKRHPLVKVHAFDQDKKALGNEVLDCEVILHNENFRNMEKVLEQEKVDGIILDLGLSSDQLENSGRGFSFIKKSEPLLMQMKENPSPEDLSAKEIVNTWEEKNLADIIYGYGEEQFARRIAKGIVEARKISEIQTVEDLVNIIEDSVPNFYRKGKINCVTKTFQALRIATNDELGALTEGLAKGFESLKVGGRMAVISFHSLEDRIVKRFFKEKEKTGEGKLVNKKPIIPSKEEISNNKRSRSAKLRTIEKISQKMN